MHTLCCITESVSNYYTVKCQFFALYLEKFTLGNFFTQAPLVVLVTNMRYAQKAPFKSKPKSASSLSSTRREGKGGTCRKLEFTGFALSNTAGGKGREAHYYSGSDRVRGTHYTVADCIFWCHICENFSGENSAALKCGNTATLWIW